MRQCQPLLKIESGMVCCTVCDWLRLAGGHIFGKVLPPVFDVQPAGDNQNGCKKKRL